MSENEYHHHAEQIEAARKEFADIWPKIIIGFSTEQQVALQKVFWQFFLHAKGLAK